MKRMSLRALSVLFVVVVGGRASADVFHVPADAPTIGEAIGISSRGDEIIVAPGVYEESLFFVAQRTIRSTDGPGATTIVGRITVADSAADSPLILDGFTIVPAEGALYSGVLAQMAHNATIRNCVITGFFERGVHSSRSSVVFEDCVISANGGDQFRGVGVFCTGYDDSPTFLRCSIIDNTGTDAGGVFAASNAHPTFIGCTIENNVCDDWGGGIRLYQSAATLIDTVIQGNQGTGNGGGISLEFRSDCTLRGCTIRNNSVAEMLNDTRGGGVYLRLDGNTLVAHDTAFEGNSSSLGAAISCGSGSYVQLVGSVVADHRATGSAGAGVLMEAQSLLVAIDSWFENNTSDPGDGAYLGSEGGAIASLGADMLVDGCTFVGNGSNGQVARGGAVYCSYDAGTPSHPNVAFFDCLFESNRSATSGGAVYFDPDQYDTRLLLDGCSFTNNVCMSPITISGVAGAAFGPVEAYHCSFVGNHAVHAAAYANATHVRGQTKTPSYFSETEFRLNDARYGAGVLQAGEIGIRMESCTFEQNSSELGPALFEFASSPGATRLVVNSRMVGNTGPELIGGDVWFINCTVAGNDVNVFHTWPDEWLIENSIFAANEGTLTAWPSNALQFRYSLVENESVSGEGNTDADPLFVVRPDPGPDEQWGTPDDELGDLRLLPGSPAIDSGDTYAYPGWPYVDLDDQPRLADDLGTPDTGLGGPPVIDMGAYEFQGRSNCAGDLTTTGTGPNDPGYGQPDAETNISDVLYFVNAWNDDLGTPTPSPGSIGDVTTTGTVAGQAGFGRPDGNVDLADLLFYMNVWNQGKIDCP